MAKQVGILGGSFNPPHIGHVAIAEYALKKGMEEVWVLPCFQHPFEKELLPFETRFKMCQLAFSKIKSVSVLSMEKKLGGVSYTYRTVQNLIKQYPNYNFFLIVGTDAYQKKDEWKNIEKLEKEIEWLIVPRGKNSPIPDISSKELRSKLAAGESCDPWLIPESSGYILAQFTRR